jgi:P4 family phage/plasmid primase-like protien
MTGPMTTDEAEALAQRWGDIDTPAGPIALKWDHEAGRIAKRPLTRHGHHDFATDPDEIRRRFAGITLRAGEELGVGLWPGPRGWWVLDLDITDSADGRDTLHELEQAGGELPVHPIGTTPSGGEHRFLPKRPDSKVGNAHSFGPPIDVRGDDGWIVAPGTTCTWGAWEMTNDVAVPDHDEMPGWVYERLAATNGNTSNERTGHWARLDRDSLHHPADLAALEALERLGGHDPYVANKGDKSYVMIARPGKKAAGVSIGYIGPGVAKVLHAGWWPLRQDARYDVDQLEAIADAVETDDRELADKLAGGITDLLVDSDSPTGDVEGALADGHRATDVGNADRLAALADGRIRYVHAWSKWIVYRDGVWHVDTGDALIAETAKRVARTMFTRAAQLSGHDRDELWKWAKRSETAPAVRAMIHLARGIPGVLVDHSDLDRHPWLLNVANGTIDLTTGRLLDHDPEDLLTLQAPVVYDPAALAPLWTACLERWQPDKTMRDYLQRAVGSAATGHPVEHLFVNIGPGANGKGKFFGAVQRTLGPYAVVPDKSLVVLTRHEPHPTVVASLFGVRLLLAPETEHGDQLAEAQIKELTGGDQVKARRMHENEWRFWPTWTAFMHTNHRSEVHGTDEGVWRRLRLIPWTTIIPEAERDTHLADKLACEAPGILNWIIAGAVAYRKHGLGDPATVVAATSSYRSDSDLTARFLAEAGLELDPAAWTPSTAIMLAHENWCDDIGLDNRRQWQRTSAGLKQRGIKPTKRLVDGKQWRGWEGIRVG